MVGDAHELLILHSHWLRERLLSCGVKITGKALSQIGVFPNLKTKQHLALSSSARKISQPLFLPGSVKVTLGKGWKASASW